MRDYLMSKHLVCTDNNMLMTMVASRDESAPSQAAFKLCNTRQASEMSSGDKAALPWLSCLKIIPTEQPSFLFQIQAKTMDVSRQGGR